MYRNEELWADVFNNKNYDRYRSIILYVIKSNENNYKYLLSNEEVDLLISFFLKYNTGDYDMDCEALKELTLSALSGRNTSMFNKFNPSLPNLVLKTRSEVFGEKNVKNGFRFYPVIAYHDIDRIMCIDRKR